eukprot:GHVU01177345.1.p1 GENE.GHVU01177345.1~~GHVU01177345.1.p1  ORF type:complete len:138 (-),score=10.64 GHVU01177345.1:40-402(-)
MGTMEMKYHEAVPADVIFRLFALMEGNGMSRVESVAAVRAELVPAGFAPHPFRRNTPESYTDQMRSILATHIYRHSIRSFKQDGVDFATYMYIPEVDEVTGVEHHHRADHGHLLKRIAGN